MPQLFTLKGGHLEKSYNIGKKISIGNIANSEIKLKMSTESPIDCEIIQQNHQYYLRKNQGHIPLLVNDQEVDEALLTHRDMISIADNIFLFNAAIKENILYEVDINNSDFLAAPKQEDNQLLLFYQMFNLASNTFNIDKLFQRIADFLLKNFQATSTLIFFKKGNSTYYKPKICRTKNNLLNWAHIKISLSKKVLYLVEKKQKAVLCAVQTKNNRSLFMITPLVYQNETIGIIILENEQKQQLFIDDTAQVFGEKELYFFGAIAMLAGNGIAHLQHYIQRKKHVRRLEILNKVSAKLSSLLDIGEIYREAVREIARLFKCTRVSILYKNNDKLRLGYAVGLNVKKVRPGYTIQDSKLVHWVIKKQKTLCENNLPQGLSLTNRTKYDTNSFIIAPILEDGKSSGAICITDKANKGRFHQQDRELLAFIAGRTGIALNNARLYQKATVDFLTGVYLRGYFLEKLELEIAKENNSISILMIDIDYFKKLNDTYGHQMGDMVLKNVGETLNAGVRESDLIGRYGGEEFIALLKNADLDYAYSIAERLRSQMEHLKCSFLPTSSKITISVGVAQYTKTESAEQLIRRCDEALYRAKGQGRNRVCLSRKK